MGTAELEFDNEFWRFSLVVYAAPKVADECLALQETFGIDVNLLLFCAWLGAARRVVLTQSDVERADAAVRNCHESVVHPLRGVRQTLKSICGDCDGFRLKVKAIELRSRANGTSHAVHPCARALVSNLLNRCADRGGDWTKPLGSADHSAVALW